MTSQTSSRKHRLSSKLNTVSSPRFRRLRMTSYCSETEKCAEIPQINNSRNFLTNLFQQPRNAPSGFRGVGARGRWFRASTTSASARSRSSAPRTSPSARAPQAAGAPREETSACRFGPWQRDPSQERDPNAPFSFPKRIAVELNSLPSFTHKTTDFYRT